LLTLTTDYTVTINANGTGSVTLVTSAGTSNITIVGAKNIQRTTDFTTGGDLFANTLNDELDNQTIFIQQVAETAERGLKAPVVDPTDINMTLPAKASRVGTVLAFNATTGNPEAGPSIGSVTTVAAQSANINTVATNIASVNTVAGNNTNINTVAGVSGNVTTVATNISNVNTVANDLNEGVSEINTVAVDIANVNNVGNNISNVNTVAGISANVTSVAGNSSNINTVAGNNANVTTVAGISGNVTTVAGISANVTTVAGINAAVSTVATNNANVSTVATNIAAVNTNATNIVAIQNASTNATNAATSATAAQTAQSAAESARDATLAAYDNFDDRYLGSKTSNPTLDNDGNALVAGALYFNSVSGAMQVYTGSAWVAAYVSGTGFLASANNLSDVASTSSARTNLGLGTIATQAASSVAITGGSINGTTIGASTPSTGAFSTLSATGVTTVQAGSVSAPAITTSGDTNTGIYFPAADTIAFTEGGAEVARFDASGNLGVGTSSPVEKITVAGALSVNTDLVLKEGTTSRGFIFGTSAGLHYRAASGLPHIFQNSGTELMRIDAGGRVSIGTTTTSWPLTVSSAGDTQIFLTSTGTNGSGQFISNGNGAGSFPAYNLYQSGTNYWSFMMRGDTNLYLQRQGGSGNIILSDGTLKTPSTISVGNATPSTSGAGITFPATQSASSNANTLDDYEEGTWTPAISMASGTSTGSSGNGTYIKIGRQVTVTVGLAVGTISAGGEISEITGLPFLVQSGNDQAVGLSRENANTGFGWEFRASSSGTAILVRKVADNSAAITTGMVFIGTVTYFVA
jgi:hypothetical protein